MGVGDTMKKGLRDGVSVSHDDDDDENDVISMVLIEPY